MEQVTQAVNDELVASLDYKLATGNTNYVQSRKSVQYYPSSLSTVHSEHVAGVQNPHHLRDGLRGP